MPDGKDEKKQGLLNIEDYRKYPMYEALYQLDKALDSRGIHEVELNVCGGFAMMTRGLRSAEGLTDIDYAGEDLPQEIRKISEEIGDKYGMPSDWINNDMMVSGFTMEEFKLSTGKLHFDPAFELKSLKINVLQEKDLLKLKVIAIDTNLTAIELGGDFTRGKDFKDVKTLMDVMHVSLDDVAERYDSQILSDMTIKSLAAYDAYGMKGVEALVRNMQARNVRKAQKRANSKLPPEGRSMIEKMLKEARRRADEEEQDR